MERGEGCWVRSVREGKHVRENHWVVIKRKMSVSALISREIVGRVERQLVQIIPA